MVLPDYIVEAVDRLPGDDGWGQIRAYLDAGGDVNDVDANGKTILNRFLQWNTIPCEASLEFVRLLVQERGADPQIYSGPARRRRLEPGLVLAAATLPLYYPGLDVPRPATRLRLHDAPRVCSFGAAGHGLPHRRLVVTGGLPGYEVIIAKVNTYS